MSFRPRLFGLLLGVLILALLTGCRPASQAPPTSLPSAAPPSPPKAGGQKILTLWTIWNTNPRLQALSDIIAAFQAAHPDIVIQLNAQEPDAYKTNIRVALGGARPPDIFFVWSGEKMLHNFVRGGNVADLTAELDANNKAWRRRLNPLALASFTYDGHTYGIPYLLQSTFFFYNKHLFAQHGWSVPRTWGELMALCEKIKAAGLIPIALGNLQKWPASHFPCVLVQRMIGKAAAERQYDPLGPGTYAEPAWIKSLQILKEMMDKGYFNKAPNGVDRAMARTLFYSGKAAMFYTGTWDFARLSKGGEAPESFWDAWDFFNFPAVEDGRGEQDCIAGAADGYVISSQTPYRAEAVKFLQFLTDVEQARRFVEKCQELVQVQGAVTEQNAGPRLRKYAQLVQQASCLSAWTDTLMEESVAQIYLSGIQELLEGKTTPEEIMRRVRQRQQEVKRELLAKSHTH